MMRTQPILTSLGDWWRALVSVLGGLSLLLGIIALLPKIKGSIIARQQATIKELKALLVRMTVEETLKAETIVMLEAKTRELESNLIEQRKEQVHDAITKSGSKNLTGRR